MSLTGGPNPLVIALMQVLGIPPSCTGFTLDVQLGKLITVDCRFAPSAPSKDDLEHRLEPLLGRYRIEEDHDHLHNIATVERRKEERPVIEPFAAPPGDPIPLD